MPLKQHKTYPFSNLLNAIPLNMGTVHFIGIGGIGMSGIAEILHNIGYQISGSDLVESENVSRLRKMGVKIEVGHRKENVENVAMVVKSTAVSLTNPEIIAAQAKDIPILKRSEMLAELAKLKATIAVAGCHGKTTTTSLIAHLFKKVGLAPTVINGGILNNISTNAYLGEGDWLVAEADESDGTFINIPALIGVITNVDSEHLDFWQSYDRLKNAYSTFIQNLPFYGFGVVCIDDKETERLIKQVHNRKIFTYGIKNENAYVRGKNIKYFQINVTNYACFDVEIGGDTEIKDVRLPMYGEHNLLNVLAAITIAVELDIDHEKIKNAFRDFNGVKRRFTKIATIEGVTIIDDYAHHPVEVEATLRSAKQMIGKKGRIISVFQPHRYTRLEQLFQKFVDSFQESKYVIVSDVYSAGEKPIKNVDKKTFVQALLDKNINAIPLSDDMEFSSAIRNIAKEGDVVIFMGAGTVTKWANSYKNKTKL